MQRAECPGRYKAVHLQTERNIHMSKRVNIAAFGLNEHLLHGKTQEEIIPFILEKIDSVRGCHPDLIALPELFLKIGGDSQNPNWRENARLMTEKLQERAGEMKCYIVNSVYEPYREDRHLRYNVAMLIGRDGEIVGKYRKMHTVQYETRDAGVIPGGEVPVFDTDFGRIALQTCFDIGWRDTWRELAGRGKSAERICSAEHVLCCFCRTQQSCPNYRHHRTHRGSGIPLERAGHGNC